MIKRLAKCIREYKRSTILTPLFMVGEVACECVIPIFTAGLINAITANCPVSEILGYGWKLLLLAVCSLTFGILSGWFCADASAGFARNRHQH